MAHTKNNLPNKHASPIAQLIRQFKLQRTHVETILPIAQCPPSIPKFTLEVAGSRKESIEGEKRDDADFKVLDGSGMDDGIGAAAVLYTREHFTPIRHLKAFLGPPTKHNTYKAELVGAILVTWFKAGW